MQNIIEQVNLALNKKGEMPEHMELEVRFKKFTRNKFYDLYNALVAEFPNGISSITNSITLSGNSELRKEIFYKNLTKTKEEVVNKKEVEVVRLHSTKISLSEEIPVDAAKFINTSAKIVRLKMRQSITTNIGWRVDFTYVSELTGDAIQNIVSLRNKFFSDTSADFINKEPKVPNLEYNVEAEWKSGKVSEKDFTNIIAKITGDIVNNYQNELYAVVSVILGKAKAAEYKSEKALKNLLIQPISFSKEEFYDNIIAHIDKFYLSDKADGERCLLVLDDQPKLIKATKTVKFNCDPTKKLNIFDAECISDNEIYVFDMLVSNGVSIFNKSYEARVEEMESFKLPPGVHKKILVKLTKDNYQKSVTDVLSRKSRTYPIDGLIFSRIDKNIVYKWKPPTKLTVDMLTVKVPDNVLGVSPNMPKDGYTLYWLFCGMKRSDAVRNGIKPLPEVLNIFKNIGKNLVPVHFHTAKYPSAYLYYHSNKLDNIVIPEDAPGVVGEYTFKPGDTPEWKLEKLRPDKDIGVAKGLFYGNACKVVSDTIDLIEDPITEEMLVNAFTIKGGGENVYFQAQKDDIYKPMVKFNSFVVAMLIKSISGVDWVIDFGAGRGNHLFTYNGYDVKNGLFMDADKEAINELTHRTKSFGDKKLYIYGKIPDVFMKVYTKVADLSHNYADTLELMSDVPLPKFGDTIKVDAVVMTFAVHYIISDLDSANNFADLVDSVLAVGGVLILTLLDGNRVFDLLKNVKTGETWDATENGTKKYSIKKLYDTDKFKDFGLRISLIHPFSAGEYYEENLVGISGLEEVFIKRGYKVRQDGGFLDYLDKFAKFNKDMHGRMSKDDKIYSGLYQYVALWRSK